MAGIVAVKAKRAVGTRQGFDVAYLKARIPSASTYQPLKWLATSVKPLWGFFLLFDVIINSTNELRVGNFSCFYDSTPLKSEEKTRD